MANQEHLDILAKGVEAWNAWQTDSREPPDLSGADLTGRDLKGFRFDMANFKGAVLRGSNLSGVNFSASDLESADFGDATLYATSFGRTIVFRDDRSMGGAEISRARFTGAYLYDTLFCNCEADDADFTAARMSHARFLDSDFSKVHGLDTVQHLSPSCIDIQTIYRSKGQIPESFLRGAGVPDNLITYMRSLTGAAFEFYSCFISYSTKDQGFAERLHADLQAKGVRCWFAPHDIQGGRKVHAQIDEAIRLYDKLLLILSDASMDSNWVKTEIANARTREQQQQRQMLFPIALVPFDRVRSWKLFDPDTGTDSAREVREYFVPDFSAWKDHDVYATAFERLLRDLKAGPPVER